MYSGCEFASLGKSVTLFSIRSTEVYFVVIFNLIDDRLSALMTLYLKRRGSTFAKLQRGKLIFAVKLASCDWMNLV